MIDLCEVVEFLDRELKISSIQDYPGAMNGLQLSCVRPIGRVIAAVDASLPVIKAAALSSPAMLLVHHGMFWQGAQPIRGPWFEKLKTAMDAGLAVYSAHLPLDVHPEWGNNILLAQALGLMDPVPFFESKGLAMGVRGTWDRGRKELLETLGHALGGRVHACLAGPEQPSQIGIITGGAGSEVAKAKDAGIDTFITGEGPHWSYVLAEELGVNLFYGGHYATETFGVKALGQHLAGKFGLAYDFIDHPSGL